MSENGPREGTRDMARPPRESGFRNMDESSAAGQAYSGISRRARRRRNELLEILRSGVPPRDLAAVFARDHPLEPDVSAGEIDEAVQKLRAHGPPSPVRPHRRG